MADYDKYKPGRAIIMNKTRESGDKKSIAFIGLLSSFITRPSGPIALQRTLFQIHLWNWRR